MTLPADLQTKFALQLQAEMVSAEELLAILNQENQILNSGDVEALEAVTREKLSGMSGLQKLHADREQFLSDCSIVGVDATEALIDGLPPDSAIARSWRQLKEIAARLKQQNDINGLIITIGQRNTNNALGILSGRQPSASMTYRPDGERRLDNSSSTLIKA